MRQVQRTPAPASLQRQVKGKTELERARDHFAGLKKVNGFTFSAYAAEDVKDALAKMFSGKCAYCEAIYDATQTEDVEHFRPKGRIDNGSQKIQPGYWWLAAAWDNLLPSCIKCNREVNETLYDGTKLKIGKGDRFPLADETKRAKAEGAHVHEMPLLINPCDEDPSRYLRFVERSGHCLIEPRSQDTKSRAYKRGRETIDVFGLNRRKLVEDRSRYMLRIQRSIRRLERCIQKLDKPRVPDRAELEFDIRDELMLLQTHADNEDRYSGMAQWLILPALKRLGVSFKFKK